MVKILDCTLRDGSHVNNNKFSDECILSTVEVANNSGIDFIEVGYKMPICIKKSCPKFVVMVDVKNLSENEIKQGKCPKLLLPSLIRVATYPDKIKNAIYAVESFNAQGFGVFLHIMTADKFEDFDVLKKWKNKNILESLYFADTFGAFMPKDVENIYKKLNDCGFEKISFHAHNNLQLAFANTIKAIELGAYSVDGSVFGMGRGAGNLPIEILLKYLNKDYSKYLDLIKKYYIQIKNEYDWGYNFETLIGGLENIHPNKTKFL